MQGIRCKLRVFSSGHWYTEEKDFAVRTEAQAQTTYLTYVAQRKHINRTTEGKGFFYVQDPAYLLLRELYSMTGELSAAKVAKDTCSKVISKERMKANPIYLTEKEAYPILLVLQNHGYICNAQNTLNLLREWALNGKPKSNRAR